MARIITIPQPDACAGIPPFQGPSKVAHLASLDGEMCNLLNHPNTRTLFLPPIGFRLSASGRGRAHSVRKCNAFFDEDGGRVVLAEIVNRDCGAECFAALSVVVYIAGKMRVWREISEGINLHSSIA